MFKKGLVVILILVIVAVFTTCSVIMCQRGEAEPPEVGDIFEIRQGGVTIRVFVSDDYELHGDSYVLNEFYEFNGNKWIHKDDKPLRISPDWGEISVRRR